MTRTKAIVICRDRVTYTKQCVMALLQSQGIGDIYLVDHGSTYEPMLDYLGKADRLGVNIHVIWQPNTHPRDLWWDGTLEKLVKPGERFIVTDHDVVAPHSIDWVDYLHKLLDGLPNVAKAGIQLTLEGVPTTGWGAKIREWEANYRPPWLPVRGGWLQWVNASVDTTLAMYRRLEPYRIDPSVRTHHIEAKHLPWFEDPDNLTEEQRYYYEHVEHAGHWNPLRGDEFEDNHNL